MNQLSNKVRLEQSQYEAIILAFRSCFLANDHLWIFGSRTNLNARGGDIDLYIETNSLDVDDAYNRKSKFIDLIWEKIGEQKIDVVVNLLQMKHETLAIYAVARTEGVQLI
jgi:hypothetical protein